MADTKSIPVLLVLSVFCLLSVTVAADSILSKDVANESNEKAADHQLENAIYDNFLDFIISLNELEKIYLEKMASIVMESTGSLPERYASLNDDKKNLIEADLDKRFSPSWSKRFSPSWSKKFSPSWSKKFSPSWSKRFSPSWSKKFSPSWSKRFSPSWSKKFSPSWSK